MENQKKTTQDENTKDACTTPREQATETEHEPAKTPKLAVCDEDKRVVLIIGKTGSGMSSMGNTLLGKEEFTVGRGMASITTKTMQSPFLAVPGIECKLQVIDTPDLSNLEMEDNINWESKVQRWKDMTSSSLFVIVLAVRCDVRYTTGDYAIYSKVKKLWRDDTAFCNNLVVGFTFGDQLDGEITQELEGVCGDLKRVLEDADGRYVVFDNTASDEEKLKQREALMQKGYKVRIILIGKTGAGKSSLGNTIAGETKFQPFVGVCSGTQKTNWAVVIRNGRIIQVTDTPGVCDTRRKPVEVYEEIVKSLTAASPGPHAILMVLKASERFTEEEGKAYDELKALFKGFENYLIIVFTRIDELEEVGQNLESQLSEAPQKLDKIIKDAGGRYIGITNKTGWTERRKEADKIVDSVYKMMAQNKVKYFSNKIFEAVAEKVDEEAKTRHVTTDQIKEETVAETNPSFMAKIRVIKKEFLKFVKACHIL